MLEIRTTAPAKINLHLAIGARRADGLHNLGSLFQSLELADELWLRYAEADVPAEEEAVDGTWVSAASADPGAAVSLDEAGPIAGIANDLGALAARAWLRATGAAGSVQLRYRKQIPLAAGLGGGSSDAAAVLLALNQLLPERALPFDSLLALAAQLGSDLPYFLYKGTAWVSGRGEVVETLPALPPLPVLLICSGSKPSTAAVYARLDASRTRQTGQEIPLSLSPELWQSMQHLRWHPDPDSLRKLQKEVRNDFTETLCAEDHRLAMILQELQEKGAPLAAISGAGPAVFAVFAEPAARDSLALYWQQHHPDEEVLCSRFA